MTCILVANCWSRQLPGDLARQSPYNGRIHHENQPIHASMGPRLAEVGHRFQFNHVFKLVEQLVLHVSTARRGSGAYLRLDRTPWFSPQPAVFSLLFEAPAGPLQGPSLAGQVPKISETCKITADGVNEATPSPGGLPPPGARCYSTHTVNRIFKFSS